MQSNQIKINVIALLGICFLNTGSANAEIVAKVTDIGMAGKAFLNEESNETNPSQEIEFLDQLERGHRVSVDENGKLTIVYLASGIEYQYAGPSTFIVGAEQPKSLNGEPKRVKNFKVLEKTGLKLSPKQEHRDQAAMVFRAMDPYPNKVKSLTPNKTKLLSSSPSFHWNPIDGASDYQFVLTNNIGRMEFQAKTQDTKIQLPSDIRLDPEGHYRWKVRTVEGEKEYVGTATFEIGSQDLSSHLTESRPNITTTFSEQVVYAMLLEQEGFKYDALGQWQRMAKSKPGNATIQAKIKELSE